MSFPVVADERTLEERAEAKARFGVVCSKEEAFRQFEERGEIQDVKLPSPFIFYDMVLEKVIAWRLGKTYWVLSIGERDFYFTLDGKFDGTGSSGFGDGRSQYMDSCSVVD